MKQRFATEFGLSPYDAATLTASREMAAYFETALAGAGREENAKPVANWVMGELSARLNKEGLETIRRAAVGAATGRHRPPHCRQHHLQQDRQGRVRGTVGG
jgi:Asp-tRNA(Asn)/Glu-tRNA(Gln) amidotransferase B subunit